MLFRFVRCTFSSRAKFLLLLSGVAVLLCVLPGLILTSYCPSYLIAGIILAIVAGSVTLINYIARGDLQDVLLAAVLLVPGLYEIVWLLPADRSFLPVQAAPALLIDHLLHALLLWSTFLIFLFRITREATATRDPKAALMRLLPHLLFLALTMYIVTLPAGTPYLNTSTSLITHPSYLLVFLIYLLLYIVIRRFQRNFPSFYSRTIILNSIPLAFSIAFLSMHQQNSDLPFNAACFFLFLSYLLPMISIIIHHISTSQKEKRLIVNLQSEINRRIERQKQLEEQEDTLKRMQAELEKSTADLKRSNAELEKFAIIASHDLQEPLRKVLAFGDRIEQSFAEVLPDRGKDYLFRMRKASERMQQMVEDLLSLSRLQKPPENFTLINLQSLIHEVLLDLDYAIEKKSARIVVNADISLRAVPNQIRQLLLNIVSNSLKFSHPQRLPLVEICAFYIQPDQLMQAPFISSLSLSYCCISVKDNGIGFDNEDAEKIFNLFHRLHPQAMFGGSGMGLALCKKIAENHSGYIAAEGKKGEGAEIKIYLPL